MPNPFEAQKEAIRKNLGTAFKVGVHSGKGGVGKTFLAVNIAYSLAEKGYNVGLLDADIDCPNVAKFLMLKTPLTADDNSIKPAEHSSVKIVSTELIDPENDQPKIIRGPIKHNTLFSFLSSADWGKLDFLVLDLPPGTADVPLSAMQLCALDVLILVSSPSKEALLDTGRAKKMADMLEVRTIGYVENMSGEIFGTNGEKTAEQMGTPLLGSIPLSKQTAKLNEIAEIAFIKNPELKGIKEAIINSIEKAAQNR